MSLYQIKDIANSSVPNPPAGFFTLFLDTDGTWKKKNSSGVVSATGSGFYNENGTISGERNISIEEGNITFYSNEPGLFTINGSSNRIGIGTNTPQSKLHIKGSSSIDSPLSQFVTGLNDMTTGGTFTGIVIVSYIVKIDGIGTPDTFRWSIDGGVTWEVTGVGITGSAQTLNNDVTITFTNTTGHTIDDYWNFNAIPNNPLTITDESGNDILSITNDGTGIIGGSSIDVSAQLEITNPVAGPFKGLLPPRMTTANKTGISTPAAGLVVYDTDLNNLYVYNGVSWVALSTNLYSSDGTLTGARNVDMDSNTLGFTNASAGVSIGTATAATSAILDLDVSSLPNGGKKGLLVPRMTTNQMNFMPFPTEGLIIYDTQAGEWKGFNGLNWITIA